MEPSKANLGTEFVLDNRKLILGFIVLVVVCGAFFAVGFMEGKRQITQPRDEVQSAPSASLPSEPAGRGEVKAEAAPSTSAPASGRSVKEQLNWYNTVQGGGATSKSMGDTAGSPKPAPAAEAASDRANTDNGKPAAIVKVPPAKVTYTVQVGAFRQRREAESKADALKVKGYEFVLEPPASSDGLFLLKVGKFSSRADAVAMEKKLRKDGFSCFIKTQ